MRLWRLEERERERAELERGELPNWERLVERVAYKSWEEGGRRLGNDEANWLKAEQVVKDELTEYARRQIESPMEEYREDRSLDATDLLLSEFETAGETGLPVPSHLDRLLRDGRFQMQGGTDGLLVPSHHDRLLLLPEVSQQAFVTVNGLLSSVAEGARDLVDLEWASEFEDLMAEILKAAGWSIKPMGYTKDGGIDLVAIRHVDPGIPIEMMVQCKRNAPSNPVGVKVVREVWSIKWKHGFHQAMIATTSRFTRGARQEAQDWKLDLRAHTEILEWCKTLHNGGIST